MNRNTKLIYKKWLLGLLIASNCNIVQPISFKETVHSSYFYRAFSFGYLSAITRISSLLSAVVVYSPFFLLRLFENRLSPESRLKIICSHISEIGPDNSNWAKRYLQDIKSIETVDYGMDFIRYLQYSSYNPIVLELCADKLSPESRLKIICSHISEIEPDNSNWAKRYLQDIKSIETVDFGKDFIRCLKYSSYNPIVLELCADKLSPKSRLQTICIRFSNIQPDSSNWVKLYLQDIKSIETVDYGMNFINSLQYPRYKPNSQYRRKYYHPIVLELCADKLSPESRLRIIHSFRRKIRYRNHKTQSDNSNWVKRYLQDIKSIEHIKSKRLTVLYLLYGPNPIKLIQQRITPFLVPSLLYLSSDAIIHKRIDPQTETLINPILDKKKQFISESIDLWNNHWKKQSNSYYVLKEYEKQLVISNCLNP